MSMSPEIMKRYLCLSTAYAIWDALSKAFYDGSDELQIFTLNQKAFSARQNGKILSLYYGELTEIYQELDHYDKVVMKDPDDVKAYHNTIERLRAHIFLAGLDEDFDQIRREILRTDLLPNLEECYSLIRREALCSTTLKGDFGASETSAMIAQNRSNQNQQERTRPNGKNGKDKLFYKCTHCNQTSHSKSRCFELVGYPKWWDPSCSKKKGPSTAALVNTTPKDNVTDIASALILTGDNGGRQNQEDDWLWY